MGLFILLLIAFFYLHHRFVNLSNIFFMEIINHRPWQGTTMAILNLIGIVIGFLVSLAFLFGASFLSAFMEDPAFSVIAGIGTSIVGIILLPFLILGIFVTLGLFKGQKWAVIVALIFTAFATIGNLTTFNLIGLLFNAFFLYCLIICMKDPYYGQ